MSDKKEKDSKVKTIKAKKNVQKTQEVSVSAEKNIFPHSCTDCGVLNCSKRNASYPEFCLTEKLTEKELEKVEKELEHVELVEEVSDVPCEKCGRMMVYKYGRYGKFLACPGYPECKNAKPIIETIDVPCPKCGATVQVRKTKRKRNYYICENNPESCDYISWNKPKPGEKWNPEEAEEIKAETKKKTTRKTAKKKAKKV